MVEGLPLIISTAGPRQWYASVLFRFILFEAAALQSVEQVGVAETCYFTCHPLERLQILLSLFG